MTDKQILAQFVTLAEFLSICYSSDMEIVVHDIENLDSSAIAIFNNHVSGRDVGASMTNKGLDFLNKDEFKNKDFVANYRGITDKGIVVRSSTYFIRNGEGRVIGTLCINVDIRKYTLIKQMMESFIGMDDREEHSSTEFFQISLRDVVINTIAEYCAATGQNIDTLSMSDKVAIVALLNEKYIFDRKGGISEAAIHLKTSEPTIYRYIKMVKRDAAAP